MNPEFNKNLPIKVVRTNRKKTASIKIIDGSVQVIVPQKLSDERVAELIEKRTPWIRQNLRQQLETIIPKPKEFVSGENFTYLGKNYHLKVLRGSDHEVKLKGEYLEVGLSNKSKKGDIRNALIAWFEKNALERLTEKTNQFAQFMGVTPNSIFVRDYKSRWGSCSWKGVISYNWRIIIAPHHIVDYVVVHELCHIQHPNHSPAYWNSVKKVIPDYKESRQWLKDHSASLTV